MAVISYLKLFNDDFLKTKFNDYAKNMCGDSTNFRNVIKNSLNDFAKEVLNGEKWYISKDAAKKLENKLFNKVNCIFSAIDNMETSTPENKGNNKVELDEIMAWIKSIYKQQGQNQNNISEEKLNSYTMADFVKIIEDENIQIKVNKKTDTKV